MSAVDLVLAVASHKSTMLALTGLLHLALFGIRRSADPTVKRFETPLSVALFPVGILQTLSLCSYIVELLVGGRGMVFSPYFQVFQGGTWPAVATVGYGLTMGISAFSATAQLGRKFPYSVMIGGGLGVLTGGSVAYVAGGAVGWSPIVLGGCALLAGIMFVVGHVLTKPWEELYKLFGEYAAFSGAVLLTSVCASILGVISGMGLVVL